jgi:chromosome segregation ATPase
MSWERSGDAGELEQHGWLRLPPLGRVLGEPLADLAAAAAFLRRGLPEIAADLSAIRTHVGSMDPEMVGMHASVERIEGQMGDLNDRIGELAERMADVERAVERLEPHVKDVNLAVRPLRRAWARVRPVQEPSEGGADDYAGTDDGGPDRRL